MAIVDVEVPSGYIYTGWKYADGLVSVIVVIETAECDYTLIHWLWVVFAFTNN